MMRPEPSDPIVEGLFALDAIFPGKFQIFKGSLETLLKQEGSLGLPVALYSH